MNTEGLLFLFKSSWCQVDICMYNKQKCFHLDELCGWYEVQEYNDFHYNNFYLLYLTSIS